MRGKEIPLPFMEPGLQLAKGFAALHVLAQFGALFTDDLILVNICGEKENN